MHWPFFQAPIHPTKRPDWLYIVLDIYGKLERISNTFHWFPVALKNEWDSNHSIFHYNVLKKRNNRRGDQSINGKEKGKSEENKWRWNFVVKSRCLNRIDVSCQRSQLGHHVQKRATGWGLIFLKNDLKTSKWRLHTDWWAYRHTFLKLMWWIQKKGIVLKL